MFNGDGTVNKIGDFATFNETRLPEWDSHWFNTEMGRIQTEIGNKQQLADNNVAIADKAYNETSQQYAAEFGVDLVEQQVKMMQYQRMYEANAQVIKTQDDLIGTLLSIKM